MIRRRFLVGLLAYPLASQQTRELRHEPVNKPGDSPTPTNIGRTDRRLALVMGNDAYGKANALHNAVNDATDMSEALKRARFDVMTVTDGTQVAMRAAVQRFASSIKPGDVVLLHYSGHGLQIDAENYLVPVDFALNGESHAKTSCVRVSETQQAFEKAGASLNIVILDACRTNPFNANVVPAKGLALMDGGLGTFIALAAGPGQTADDNPRGRNGLFTHHLLAEMERPGQPIDSVFQRVKRQVFDISGGRQRPWLHSDVVAEFHFHAAAQATQTSPEAPGNPATALIRAGQLQFQLGDFEQAAKSFEHAMRINPEDPFIYNALGVTYAWLKKWSLAVGLYAKAIELKPDYATAYFNRGVAYSNAARYDLAIQDFSWALDQEPYDPLVFTLRGRAYFAQLDYPPALEDFNHALELNGSDSAALLGRGNVLFRQGRMPDALRDLTLAIHLRPTAEAFESRAQVHRAMGRAGLADADAREALRLRAR